MKRLKNLSYRLSERIAELPDSVVGELFAKAQEAKGLISLGPGEPNFVAPKHIREAAKKALDQGKTHYAPASGLSELKEEIAKKLKKKNRILLDDPQKEVVVTNGSTEALLLAYMNIVDINEELLIPNPGFLAYRPALELIDAVPVDYELQEGTGFQIDVDGLKKKISKKTMAILLNTPGNPTGTVLKKNVLEEIADIAVQHDLMVLSDEAYEDFVYGKAKHISMGALNGLHEYTVTMHTFSKSYAMPGLRVGYASGPEWMIERMAEIHVYSSLSAGSISQQAALAALKGTQKPVEMMRKSYEKRGRLILKRIAEIPELHVEVEPEGAFYVFPRITMEMNSLEFVKFLLKEAKVIAIPGTAFGTGGQGFVRMSFATEAHLIEQAMDAIEKALHHARK